MTDKIKEIREAEEKLTIENQLTLELSDIKEQIDVFKKSGITDAIEHRQKKENEQGKIRDYLQSVKSIGNELILPYQGKLERK